MLPKGPCSSPLSLVSANKVSVGDCVMTVNGKETVTSSERILEEGIYTIVSGEDLVVVDGIVASPFAMNHFIPNMFYNIHRYLFSIMPSFLSSKMMESVSIVADEISKYYTIDIMSSK